MRFHILIVFVGTFVLCVNVDQMGVCWHTICVGEICIQFDIVNTLLSCILLARIRPNRLTDQFLQQKKSSPTPSPEVEL